MQIRSPDTRSDIRVPACRPCPLKLREPCAEGRRSSGAGGARSCGLLGRKRYSAVSIFTLEVMSFHDLIWPASQAWASSSDLLGTVLKLCFWNALTTGCAFKAAMVAA